MNDLTTFDLIVNIFGYAGSLGLIAGFLPQTIVTLRTRNTEGVHLLTFLLIGVGAFCFVVQGWMLHNWPLVITNIITTISSVIITYIKVTNDYRKRHPRE